jgi:hypothetical protein
MKRIVICFDGTWNALTDPASVTNVVRVGQAVKPIAADGTPQVVYYNAGVGSGGPLDRVLGGVFGVGLRGNVKRGLAFLTLNWEPGDEIYILGFSRGAYSARALAGVLTAIEGVPKKEQFHRLEDLWNIYRLPRSERRISAGELEKLVWQTPANEFVVKCLAVWDTVGSYGIPAGLGLGGLARRWTSWTRGFHDNIVSRRIQVALQALALDEARRAFPATTWLHDPLQPTEGQSVEQVWFAGAHSNIGGGYQESGLSDLALLWMLARIETHTGLEFSRGYIAENFWPCAACSLYSSTAGWWLSSLFPFRRTPFAPPTRTEVWSRETRQRVMRDLEPANEKIHWSVVERLGRKAIVDEKISKAHYAPRNLETLWNAGKWREEDRPLVERDPRVAAVTDLESQFIELCRDRDKNGRLDNCALACALKLGAGGNAGMLDRLRGLMSAEVRQGRRRQRLREAWGVPENWPPPRQAPTERDKGGLGHR